MYFVFKIKNVIVLIAESPKEIKIVQITSYLSPMPWEEQNSLLPWEEQICKNTNYLGVISVYFVFKIKNGIV